ncbi:unnamed protein product [Cladocopium goreaui]|uniref:Uncharacterized protein n=1 Tax=Cladocopium goreaui TaxID=2562237 RepID=A0A9P1DGB1_9DINO|nr:unnamed protein product [Cladocopium goreaui]
MMEVVRTDVMRGAFGRVAGGDRKGRNERPEAESDDPPQMLSYDPEADFTSENGRKAPYKTMEEASGNHGLVEEILGFFVAPFSGHYSFMTWGRLWQDVWLSESPDPKDMVQVAERIDYVACRTGNRRRAVHTGCSIFYNSRSHTSNQLAHVGTKLTEAYGTKSGQGLEFRTPTEVSLPLEQGERRFFVKRQVLPEDWNWVTKYVPRDRQVVRLALINKKGRAYTATGLRIHKPDRWVAGNVQVALTKGDLSNLTAAQRELLADRKSWPETLGFERREMKPTSSQRGPRTVKITRYYSKSLGSPMESPKE